MSMDTEGQATPEELAAFSAGFDDTVTQAAPAEASNPATATETPDAQPEVAAEEPIALTAEEIRALRATAAEVAEMKAQVRSANGRIGALNDLLHKANEQKKAEGKPAALTTVEMRRIKEAYPELAEDLSQDINEALASLRPQQQDPDEVARLIKERVAEASHELRKEALAERHPDWEDVKRSESFWKWMEALPDAERTAIQTSASPMFIASKLDTFKSWRDKGTRTRQQSQERLESAITPTGGSGTGKSNLSDEEAMQKAFAEGFNS